MKLLKSSLSLLFFSLWQLDSLAPGTDESKQIVANTKSKIYLKVKGCLKDWVVGRKVIGGSIFGGTVDQRFKGGLAKDISEINVSTVKTKGLFQSGYRSSQLHDFTYCRQQ